MRIMKSGAGVVPLLSIIILFWVPRLWPQLAGINNTKLERFRIERRDALVNGCCTKPDLGLRNVQPWDTCSAGREKTDFIPCISLMDHTHPYISEFIPHLPPLLQRRDKKQDP